MTIVGRQLIKKFLRRHANARPSLSAWLEEAEDADWKTPQDIKDRYRSADILSGNRVVFNIGGNNSRLVVLVTYRNGILMIQKIGTHADYDKWDLK